VATIQRGEQRHQLAHYGLYRTGVGGDERIIVRRKVGVETDYQHKKSMPVRRQRERLATASRHWRNLTPTQKAFYRNQIAFVTRSGSQSEEVLLKGRELFISREINSLVASGKQLLPPYEICIVLCDEQYHPLTGHLWLSYYENEEWHSCYGQEIGYGQFLFSSVPRGKEFYRISGRSPGYYDPQLLENQWASEQYLLQKHYHILLFMFELLFVELWTATTSPPAMDKIIEEPWNKQTQPLEYEQVIYEPWSN